MKGFDPMKLLYPPRPKTEAAIKQLEAEGKIDSTPLARALGKLAGEMRFFGKTDEEVCAAINDCF